MERDILLHVDHCMTPATRIGHAAIVLRGSRIFAVGGFSAFQDLERYDVLEMPDCYAIPGLVDTHIYGASGVNFMDCELDEVERVSMVLAKHGITTFLPTTQSAPPRELLRVVSGMAQLCQRELSGAQAAGIHIDGPFLNPSIPGAHGDLHLRPIDLDETHALLKASRGHTKIFSFAPELANAERLTRLLVARGVMPSQGHSKASKTEIEAVLDLGGSRCSHVMNAMAPLAQRSVSLAAIALTDPRMWVELIVDGIHIDPTMIRLACSCIQPERLVCISNAMQVAALEQDGTFQLGQSTVEVKAGFATIVGKGKIAGATRLLDENYRRLREYTRLSDLQCTAACTLNPAMSVGLSDRGSLRPGKRADIVVFDKATHAVRLTIVGGKIVYRA